MQTINTCINIKPWHSSNLFDTALRKSIKIIQIMGFLFWLIIDVIQGPFAVRNTKCQSQSCIMLWNFTLNFKLTWLFYAIFLRTSVDWEIISWNLQTGFVEWMSMYWAGLLGWQDWRTRANHHPWNDSMYRGTLQGKTS